MALSTVPHIGFSVSVAGGAANTAATIQPYDNTHSFAVYNPDSALDVYVGFGTTGAAQLTVNNATRIPPQSAFTFPIGVHRAPYDTPTATASGLLLNASGAGPISVNITYINQMPR